MVTTQKRYNHPWPTYRPLDELRHDTEHRRIVMTKRWKSMDGTKWEAEDADPTAMRNWLFYNKWPVRLWRLAVVALGDDALPAGSPLRGPWRLMAEFAETGRMDLLEDAYEQAERFYVRYTTEERAYAAVTSITMDVTAMWRASILTAGCQALAGRGVPPTGRVTGRGLHHAFAIHLSADKPPTTGRDRMNPAYHPARLRQLMLLREIAGNPFKERGELRTTAAANKLAALSYHDRAFETLPVLADMLEEAGTTWGRLLNHLRMPAAAAVHCRGCWALDLILGFN